MTIKGLLLGAVALSVGLVAACQNDHRDQPPTPVPPPSTSQSLDTAQVLLLAKQSSETSSPIAVNGGALTINDTSETTAPIVVNAM